MLMCNGNSGKKKCCKRSLRVPPMYSKVCLCFSVHQVDFWWSTSISGSECHPGLPDYALSVSTPGWNCLEFNVSLEAALNQSLADRSTTVLTPVPLPLNNFEARILYHFQDFSRRLLALVTHCNIWFKAPLVGLYFLYHLPLTFHCFSMPHSDDMCLFLLSGSAIWGTQLR